MRIFFLTLFLVSTSFALPTGDFKLQEGSTLEYKVIHKFHEVHGISKKMEARAVTQNGESDVMVRVAVDTFDSGNANRDVHAKEVLEAQKFPYVVLKAKLADAKDGKIHTTGILQFHGQEKTIELDVTVTKTGDSLRADFEFPIKLTDYKVERPSLLFVKINDEVQMKGSLLFK